MCLDAAGGSSANGTNIQLWQRGNVAWNKWKLTKVTAPICGNKAYDDKNDVLFYNPEYVIKNSKLP